MSIDKDILRQLYEAEMRLAAIAENRARAMVAGDAESIATLLHEARTHLDRAAKVWDEPLASRTDHDGKSK